MDPILPPMPPPMSPEQLAHQAANQPVSDRAASVQIHRATPQNIDPIRGQNRVEATQAANALPTAADEDAFAAALKGVQAADKAGVPVAAPGAAPAAPKPTTPTPPGDVAPPAAPAVPAKFDATKPPRLADVRPKTPAKAAQWDELKASYEARLQAVNAELAQLRGKATVPAEEVTKLTKERDQYKDIVKGIAIERDPEFSAKYDSKRDAVVALVKQVAGQHATQIASLLTQPASQWRDSQIDTIVQELDGTAQRRVASALNVLESIDIDRQAEIAQRRASFDDTQEAKLFAGRAEQQRRQAALQATFDTELRQWSDATAGIEYFTAKEGDSAHNTTVDETIALAKRIYHGDASMTEQDMATAAMWSAAAPRLAQDYYRVAAENDQLRTELDRIRGSAPGAGLSTPVGGLPAAPTKPGSEEDLAFWNEHLASAQAKDRGYAR